MESKPRCTGWIIHFRKVHSRLLAVFPPDEPLEGAGNEADPMLRSLSQYTKQDNTLTYACDHEGEDAQANEEAPVVR